MHLKPMIIGGYEMTESDQNKIKILRRMLDLKTQDAGRWDSGTQAFAFRMSRLLAQAGDPAGCLALRTEYYKVDPDDPGDAVSLNCLALDWRKLGRPQDAEPLLRQAREMESRLLPRNASQHPHRLNNLSTVLIMQLKLDEAKVLLRRAWALMKGKHDTTSVRIMISRLAVSLLESKPSGVYIGRLKTLLEMPPRVAGIITPTTSAAVLVDHLKAQLSEEDFGLLHALYRAGNDPEQKPDLEKFEQWRRFNPVPLDLCDSDSSD